MIRFLSVAREPFLQGPEEFDAYVASGGFAPMSGQGPLLTTNWHQGEPYNNYCPMGDGGRCLVGCVALAAAQVMRYHRWPVLGKGDHDYMWDGDDSCGGSTSGGNMSADFEMP